MRSLKKIVPLLLCLASSLQGLAAARAAGVLDGVEAVYDGVEVLSSGDTPVVCILDTEHPDVIRNDVRQKGVERYKNRLFRADIERITGTRCLLLHYTGVGADDLLDDRVKAIVVTARQKRINDAYDEALFAFFHRVKVPTLGICGAHQMIVEAFGGRYEAMRPLQPLEADPRPQYWPGQMKEWGFYALTVYGNDPLFAALGPHPVVREFHAFEVTQLPAEFELLASTPQCRVQAIRHKGRPLYGTQFHPERYDAEHPDGERILANFFAIAGIRP